MTAVPACSPGIAIKGTSRGVLGGPITCCVSRPSRWASRTRVERGAINAARPALGNDALGVVTGPFAGLGTKLVPGDFRCLPERGLGCFMR